MQPQNSTNFWFDMGELWKKEETLIFDLNDDFEFAKDDKITSISKLTGEVEFRKMNKKDLLVALKNIEIKIELECSKCLEKFEYKIKIAEASEVFFPWSDNPEDWLWDYDNSGVDLYEFLREKMILSLPAVLICQENCKGICAHCGKNLNKEKCDCDKKISTKKASPFDGLEEIFSREK